jgi:uncharacterized OB-fold protein
MFAWFGKVNFSPYTKVTEFANYLKDGHLMGSRCKHCGYESFPPRADCSQCLSGDFEYIEFSGHATLVSFTTIHAAPTGFEDVAPYTIGVVGDSIAKDEIKIGMELQVVPQIFEELEQIKVYYSLEKPGTTWAVSESKP